MELLGYTIITNLKYILNGALFMDHYGADEFLSWLQDELKNKVKQLKGWATSLEFIQKYD